MNEQVNNMNHFDINSVINEFHKEIIDDNKRKCIVCGDTFYITQEEKYAREFLKKAPNFDVCSIHTYSEDRFKYIFPIKTEDIIPQEFNNEDDGIMCFDELEDAFYMEDPIDEQRTMNLIIKENFHIEPKKDEIPIKNKRIKKKKYNDFGPRLF